MTIEMKSPSHLSIGGLSAACEIPAETLRNWENRYGFPNPERLPSGHRRYRMDLLPRLRKIRRLVANGYKPSVAVNASDVDIDHLLETLPILQRTTVTPIRKDWIDHALMSVRQMAGISLQQVFHRQWHILGARSFILDGVLPFLQEIGDQWEAQHLSVAHEHFASEVLQEFLAHRWRSLMQTGYEKRIVLANPEGDLHSLGIQMAAILSTLNNIEPIFLGPNTPLGDIVQTARDQRVDAVVVGLSSASDPHRSARFLDDLYRGVLGIRLAFGGNHRLTLSVKQIEYIPTLEAFDTWCDQLART